jgi:hypothetical protein
MSFLAFFPGVFCGEASGLGRAGQYPVVVPAHAGTHTPRLLDFAKASDALFKSMAQRGMGPGVRRDDMVLFPSPLVGGIRTYTEAVVTPPSTMMVCPVMKLEASEPR